MILTAFHRLSARVLAVVLGVAILVSACAPAATPSPGAPVGGQQAPATSASAPSAAAQPKYGGVLKFTLHGDPPSLDAQQDVNAHVITAPAYNLLVQWNPLTGKELVPDLAERWSVSSNGLTYTFNIRKGPVFHDGKPFTADDIVFSLERMIRPPQGILSNVAFLLRPVVDKIEKSAEDTVVVTVKYPYAPFLATLATDYTPIYPKHVVLEKGNMKTTVLGTGPFKLKSFTPGIGAELVKNPDYWVKGRPYLDGINIAIIQDVATRNAALRTHQVNMSGRIFEALTASQVEQVKKEVPQLRFVPASSPLGPHFFMNMRTPPFNDVRVRKALFLAFDRQGAIKSIAEGTGALGSYFGNMPGWGLTEEELLKLPGYSAATKQADIEAAKKLLADAGYSKGFELDILSRENAVTQTASVYMSGQLQVLGVRATVRVLQDPVFFTRGRNADFTAMVFTPAQVNADPVWMGRFWAPGGALNYTGNENDKYLKDTWERSIQELDVSKRKALIRDVERYMLTEQMPALPMAWPHIFVGVWPEVQNMVIPPTDYANNRHQEVWLSK